MCFSIINAVGGNGKGMVVGGVNTVEIAVKTGEIGRILGKKGIQAPIVGRCF